MRTLLIVLTSLFIAGNSQANTTHWRGLLELQPGVSIVFGIEIHQQNNERTLTVSSPNQNMFGYIPSEFKLEGNSVFFQDSKLQASFQGQLTDDDQRLVGIFKQQGERALTLLPLSASDNLARQQFEGAWAGELIMNRKNKLPLQLNIAVVHGGYFATLDSPRQQSYGIPVSEISITSNELSFKSELISAEYNAQWQENAWHGEFLQGQVRPLILSRPEQPQANNSNKKKLSDWLNSEFDNQAVAIAIITGNQGVYQVQQVLHGLENAVTDTAVNAETLFEIGSVTKPMVALMLAQQFTSGALSEATTATDILGAEYSAHNYRFVELATHHSGLPRLPENLPLHDLTDPYANYQLTDLHTNMRDHAPGQATYTYSNYGYGLLAELLARHTGKPVDQLFQELIFTPFNMPSSYLARPGKAAPSNLTIGHDIADTPMPHWHFASLAGAGAVVSNLTDMSHFVQTLLQQPEHLKEALQRALTAEKELSTHTSQALGWILQEDGDNPPFAWHSGQTAGFSSFVAFSQARDRGVVILSSKALPVTTIGLQLLTQPEGWEL